MIKLVVSDIDETLLKEGTAVINPELFEVIRELKKKGIIFVAASGRQYGSMKQVFAPVAEDIYFIAENGSLILKDDEMLFSDFIAQDLAEDLVRHLRTYEDGELLLSVPEQLFVEKDGEAKAFLEKGYLNRVDCVPDVIPYCSHTNKITLYRNHDIDALSGELQSLYGDSLNVRVAGKVWVDLMNSTSDKGNAINWLQKKLGITREETMAFGDNCNDIGMIQQAGESYAVANAHPSLKAAARYETGSYQEDGVIRTIRERLLD